MIKKDKLIVLFLLCGMTIVGKSVCAQMFAVKTSLPALVTTNLNVGFEAAVAPKFSIEAHVFANPWRYSDRYDFLLVGVQPGVRYWFKDTFAGSFVGAQMSIAAGDVVFKTTNYQGYVLGGGISYGYAWILGVRWNLEGEVGLGYYNANYRTRATSAKGWGSFGNKSFIAPSKLSLNLVYLF